MHRKQGFSLLEAIAVICLMSILASGSVLFLSRPLSQARNNGSLRDVLNLHRRASRECRNNPIMLSFDLQRQRVAFREGTAASLA